MDNFLDRIECEICWLSQSEEDKIQKMNEIAKLAFELGKEHESVYTDIVGDGISNYMVFAKEPFNYEEAKAWFDFLLEHPEEEHSKKKNVVWQTKLIGLRGDKGKLLTLDEEFWANIDFIRFHSAYIEISLLKGKPLYYLSYWFYEETEDDDCYDDGIYTFDLEIERYGIFKEIRCTHRFRKDADEFRDFLYAESKRRDLINYDHMM